MTNRIEAVFQIQTAETDTTLRLAPDGAGGVEWGTGGGGGSSPLTTKGDVYGHSTVDARIPVGSNGQVLTADSTQTLGLKWATPGGGGGGSLTTPVILDSAFGGATLTLGSTHGSGTRFVLGFNGSDNSLTSIAQTNVTWAAVKTFTDSGGTHYEVWVGIATGTSGTSVAITTSSSFTSACVGAISDALTPTLGANTAVNKTGQDQVNLSGATPGSLLALMTGNDNTTFSTQIIPMFPCSIIDNNPAGAGVGHGLDLLLGYAPTGDAWMSISGTGASAGAAIICEIT